MEIVLRTRVDKDLTVHMYLLGMNPKCRNRFKEMYQTQHPGEHYEWRHVHTLNETLGNLRGNDSSNTDERARKAITLLAANFTDQQNRQKSEVRNS